MRTLTLHTFLPYPLERTTTFAQGVTRVPTERITSRKTCKECGRVRGHLVHRTRTAVEFVSRYGRKNERALALNLLAAKPKRTATA